MSINRVNISGNLTRDGELRQTQSGTAVLSLGVAVNDRRRNQQTGEWEDVPNFVDCIVFGQRAQGIAQYMTKGAKVAVEGKLRWSSWEKDGQKRSKLEVVVDEIEFMSRREERQPQGYAPQAVPQAYAPAQAAPQAYAPAQASPQPYAHQGHAPQKAPQSSLYDEDIPFN